MYERLADLLRKARNLRILDWQGSVFPSADDFNILQTLEHLKTLRLCASTDETDQKLDHFACSLGPLLNSLELRSVDMQMYRSLESQYKHFSAYHSLHHLSRQERGTGTGRGLSRWAHLIRLYSGISDSLR